jgi:hypothetical protein
MISSKRRIPEIRLCSSQPVEVTMKKASAGKKIAAKRHDKDLDQAIRGIYKRYGPDLSVFFRAVRDHLNLERQEARKR